MNYDNINIPKSIKNKFSISSIKDHFQKISYNEEQLQFIHSPLESSSLNGIPGGGKTASIIGKIIYHFLQHHFTKTNHYKLFTFSKRACSDFITKGKHFHSRIFQKSSIQTLHSLSGKLIYYITQKKSSSQSSIIMSAYYLFEKDDYKTLLQSYEPLKSCKIIFVDEAQDISDIQYKLIMKIREFYNIPVIMIGDPNQNIYQFQNGSDKYLLEHKGPRYFLKKNYRSTPEIIQFVNDIRPWENLTTPMIPVKSSLETPHKPVLFIDSVQNIIQNIINTIFYLHNEKKISFQDMAIIGPVKKSKPSSDYYTNIGLSLFTNLLKTYNIQYIKHYEDGDDSGSSDIDKEIKYSENSINLFTIHGSKGLEFKAVFLLNFHLNTYGIAPSEEDYNKFKYLWYVGVSRAQEYLYIYIDEKKYAWYDLKNVPLNHITYESKFPKLLPKLEFKDNISPLIFKVTDIIRNKKYMNDRLYYYFYEALGDIKIIKSSLWEKNDLPTFYDVDHMDYYKIYGIFMENIFNLYYHYSRKIIPDYVVKTRNIIVNTIQFPKKYNKGYMSLKRRLPEIEKNCITLSQILPFKNILNETEIDFFSYLILLLDNHYEKEFYLKPENDVISYPRDRILEKINIIYDFIQNISFENNQNNILYEAIFEISIFLYQLEHECAYLWSENLNHHIIKLNNHIIHISEFASKLYIENSKKNEDVYIFHKKLIHQNLPIIGELDMINQTNIIDLKFSHSSMEKYIDQIMMYYMLYDPRLETEMSLELWNILNGERCVIQIDISKIKKVIWLQVLCKAIQQKLKNMVFIYDLETTGLYYTNHMVDIIERHVEDYGTKSVWSYGLVKPQTLPFIPFEITQLTGITKEEVFSEGDSLQDMKEEFDNILRYCDKPLFIAHNGNAFDHKLLLEKSIVNNDDCRFIDSRMLLRLLIPNKNIAEKSLETIYKYYYPEDKEIKSHRAKDDVKMLIKIFEKIGLKNKDLDYL